jgi:hypothetical protein
LFKSVTIGALCTSFGVLQPGAPLAASEAYAQAPTPIQRTQLNLRIQNRITSYKTEADRFDAAMRGLAAVERMPLNTEADAKQALAVLQRGSAGTQALFGKVVSMAINNSAFKSGVEAEVDRVSAKTLHLQARQKSTSVTSLRGFSETASAIRREIEGHAATLRRVGDKLQAAAKRNGAIGSAPMSEPRQFVITRADYRSNPQSTAPRLVKASYSPLTAGPVVSSSLEAEPFFLTGIEEALIIGAGVVIAAYALRKSLDFSEPEDPGNEEDTRSRFRVCTDNADATRDRCLRNNDFWGDIGCWAKWNVEMARCLVLPL